MKFLHAQKNKGFTLLETLIAIMILTLAIAASFAIASRSLTASFYSKKQTTAIFLASEGIELARNIRDNVKIYNDNPAHSSSQIDWLKPLRDGGCVFAQNATGGCDIDATAASTNINNSGALEVPSLIKSGCSSTGCELLVTFIPPNSVSAYTSQGGTGLALYSRKIKITEYISGSKKEAVVVSTVYWNNGNDSFSATSTLANL